MLPDQAGQGTALGKLGNTALGSPGSHWTVNTHLVKVMEMLKDFQGYSPLKLMNDLKDSQDLKETKKRHQQKHNNVKFGQYACTLWLNCPGKSWHQPGPVMVWREN